MKDQGYLYIFRDENNNNLIKVGFSKDPIARIEQLYNTSSAERFTMYCLWHVDNMRKAEEVAHFVLKDHRINPKREFFEIAPEPHFSAYDTVDYDTSCIYLDALIEIIDNMLYDMDVEAVDVNIRKFYEHYYEGRYLFPEGVKGF
ncbi:TPA: GIY-YIG nuclease family protein [Vibrio parahaemolyticus]|uniref:GIY-YIG nuclease family protein n=1 Tax=Vibrio parahaemolyticus TaxID=670 RepID=UPI000472283E|nr:GIY-YIG nuclease family protein [Vibrio parahaemolyticus]HAS6087995.1 hypothetical protein [Vibrio vulnificus]MCR9731410.1 GIY-YIG nuclease family protein [Vibrio parahaemolyticus]MCR9754911.1 GIY-YIG nuclease family protein [Vibrio parahaemolyticus]MCR9785703.1 GIY-YIG nuclease family protein [Vibrio parahaemolyticus]MCR9862674.1 GIY-YIG nuclease family protein [Vibrio parahaemolyticus]